MKQKDSFWSKNKTFILLFVSVLTGIFLLRSFLSIMARVPEENYRVLNHITVEVEDQQGKVETFDSHLFNFTSCQDKITMHIPLEKAWEKENQSINFFFYNSVVKAYYKDQLLATYGENLKRHMIGKLLVSILVPPEAFGEEIRVEIFPKMHFMENNFDAPVLINDRDAMFFTIIGQETSYALFVMTLIATFLGMVIFLFFSPRHIYAREGFWLMAMIFALTLWHLGNSGMLYKLSDDADLSAVGEYIGMYLLLPSAPIYASYETERPRVKKYLRIVGSICSAIFVLTLVLYLLPTGYTYVWNLRWAQALQLVILLSCVLSLIFPGRATKNSSDRILEKGLVVVALLGVLEQLRLILSASVNDRWPSFMQTFVKIRFSKVLIIVMVFIFITSYSFKLILILQKNLEDEHLRVLAFSDSLTLLGNRQYLQRKLDLMDNQKAEDYGVIFMDINDLKFTNDHYGHDSGDKLIRMVASAIKDAVDPAGGFCGRNGGDEFIAVVSPEGSIFSVAEKIQENLEAQKEKERVKFPVSLSLGLATHSELSAEAHLQRKDYVTSDYVIRKADYRMYQHKCQVKQARIAKNRKV
jgi:possible diguanylate cyclase and metal dependent phosphohydrolase